MKVFFFIVFVAGALLGFAYPAAYDRLKVQDTGTWQVYRPADGFKPVTVALSHVNAPITVLVDLTAARQTNQPPATAILTLTADVGGETMLAAPLAFEGAPFREGSPQDPVKTWRQQAGVIELVEDAEYIFTVGTGDAAGVRIEAVDLLLSGGGATADPRAAPVGYAVMAIGVVGFLLSFRRRRVEPDEEEPAARWGRGGDPKP